MMPNQESAKHRTRSSLDSSSKCSEINFLTKEKLCSMNPEEIRNVILPSIQDAINRNSNDEVIQQSNFLIDNVENEELLVSAIKLQIKAWRNKGNLIEQLQRAETLITMVPEDPEGYINAADVYSARGQQKSVMDITKKGMKNVPNTTDAYEELARQYYVAETRMLKRVDILGQLPWDLACGVIEYLPQLNLDEWLQISPSWRELVLGYPIIWRIFVFTNRRDSLFAEVIQYIEEVDVCAEAEDEEIPVLDKFIEALGSFQFPRLRRLEIYTECWDHDRYNSTLSSVSTTVTELELQINGEQPISLSRILMDFRNLTSLGYICEKKDQQYFTVSTLPYTTILRYINIKNELPHPIRGGQLDGLLKSVPYARKIILTNFGEEVLPTIHEYCPDLTALELNVDYNKTYSNFILQEIPDDVKGLQYMVLERVESIGYVKDLMESHQNTLKELNINMCLSGNPDRLSTTPLPNVETLTLNMNIAPAEEHHIISLIRHCPSTRILTFDYRCHQSITNNTFQAIGLLQYLEELVIYDVDILIDEADEATVIRSFQRLRNLKNVKIDRCDGTTKVLLNAVSHIFNLERVSISGKNNWTLDDFQEFTRKLSMLKHLRTVIFSRIEVSVDALKEFQKSNSVESILIRSFEGIVADKVREALPSHISVKFIKLYQDEIPEYPL
ncbi:hypothetical protein BDA99DRAFT_531756 [Phascolomyces articulosus]|uniref:F-box domain-containing protein n=1 Tax=Phascolomyces articulosus TaxID=60185 RepID=A0AAD5KA36_9FUNG|nr:hypothetical protein BDA99DRAFT_531756 [Phascolomyces articulosus]